MSRVLWSPGKSGRETVVNEREERDLFMAGGDSIWERNLQEEAIPAPGSTSPPPARRIRKQQPLLTVAGYLGQGEGMCLLPLWVAAAENELPFLGPAPLFLLPDSAPFLPSLGRPCSSLGLWGAQSPPL